MFLKANGPFDLAQTLDSGQTFRWRHYDNRWRTCVLEGNLCWVRQAVGGLDFRSTPEPETIFAPKVIDYFRLEDDLEGLYERFGNDEVLQKAILLYPGLRLLRQDPWECLIAFVISSYSNMKRIARHIQELCAYYGDSVLSHEYSKGFPGQATLSSIGEAELRKMGLGYRAKYVDQISKIIFGEKIDLKVLRKAKYENAKHWLLGLKGVGEKVANCVLAFSLDHGRAFPVDVWIRRAVQDWYFDGEPQSDHKIGLWGSEKFGLDAAYAQQYLFHRRRLQEL